MKKLLLFLSLLFFVFGFLSFFSPKTYAAVCIANARECPSGSKGYTGSNHYLVCKSDGSGWNEVSCGSEYCYDVNNNVGCTSACSGHSGLSCSTSCSSPATPYFCSSGTCCSSTSTTNQCTSNGGRCEQISPDGGCAAGETQKGQYSSSCSPKICCTGTATNQCVLNGGTCEVSACKTGEAENTTYSPSCPSGGGSDKGVCCQPQQNNGGGGTTHYTCTDTPGQTCLPDCGTYAPGQGGSCAPGLTCCSSKNTAIRGCNINSLSAGTCPKCDNGFTWNSQTCQCTQTIYNSAQDKTIENVGNLSFETCTGTQLCYQGCGCDKPCTANTQVKSGSTPPCGTAGVDCQTAIGSISTDPSTLIKSLFSVLLAISGLIAVILIITSGYRLMFSRGNPEQLQNGKDQLTAAIIGLIFVIFSFLLIQIIFVNFLQIK